MNGRDRRSGFVLGVLHAAWFLNYMHGEDSFAEELLLELGPSIDALQRLARAEEYQFKAGFWSQLRRRRQRNRREVERDCVTPAARPPEEPAP